MKAAALAPQALLLPVDLDEYRRYSRQFKEAVAEIAPVIEDRGIDEIYIDLSQSPDIQGADDFDVVNTLRDLARRIQGHVRHATGLTCSIGVTPNKLLSKQCSDLDKPNGVTVLALAGVGVIRLGARTRGLNSRVRKPAIVQGAIARWQASARILVKER